MTIYQRMFRANENTRAANLCAYEKANTQANTKSGAKVIFGPQIMRHVLNDRPVCFPLLFIRHRLLSEQWATFCRRRSRVCSLRLYLRTVVCIALLYLKLNRPRLSVILPVVRCRCEDPPRRAKDQ